jgi:hypothetical protein
MIVTSDRAAAHLRVTGTHTGTLFDMPATGRPIDVRQMQFEWFTRVINQPAGSRRHGCRGFARYAFDAASSLSGVTLSGSIRTIR